MALTLKEIKGFPNYFVSNSGEVYSKIISSRNQYGNLKMLKYCIDTTGYPFVNLYKNKKEFKRHIHRLVAEAFIPNPENKSDVNHINGIRNDNRVENLEWNTRSENLKHSYRILGRKPANIRPVSQIKDGMIIAEFYSTADACRHTGISFKQIQNSCRLGCRAANYYWKYK